MSEYLKKWQWPSDYIGARWDGFYVFIGQNRDSGALERANFDAAWKALESCHQNTFPGGEEEENTVQKVSENHWACGWIEWIAIHESDTAAIAIADRIMEKLESYPVIDENLWSEYEETEAREVWGKCYSVKERVNYVRRHRSQFEFGSFSDLLGCIRGKYFAGYASELLH